MRLSRETQDTLRDLAKVYGSPNKAVFTREMIESICSGDPARVSGFLQALMTKIGAHQYRLAFDQAATQEAEKQAKKAKRKPRR
jgi:hypothetical protein